MLGEEVATRLGVAVLVRVGVGGGVIVRVPDGVIVMDAVCALVGVGVGGGVMVRVTEGVPLSDSVRNFVGVGVGGGVTVRDIDRVTDVRVRVGGGVSDVSDAVSALVGVRVRGGVTVGVLLNDKLVRVGVGGGVTVHDLLDVSSTDRERLVVLDGGHRASTPPVHSKLNSSNTATNAISTHRRNEGRATHPRPIRFNANAYSITDVNKKERRAKRSYSLRSIAV